MYIYMKMFGQLVLIAALCTSFVACSPEETCPTVNDPCTSYFEINDTTRDPSYVDYTATQKSDTRLVQRWYRGASPGVDIPRVPPTLQGACFAMVQIWLNDTYPSVSDGIIEKEVCVAFVDSCTYTYNICVKNCGSFNVYYLVRPQDTFARYCFGPTTVDESSTVIDIEQPPPTTDISSTTTTTNIPTTTTTTNIPTTTTTTNIPTTTTTTNIPTTTTTTNIPTTPTTTNIPTTSTTTNIPTTTTTTNIPTTTTTTNIPTTTTTSNIPTTTTTFSTMTATIVDATKENQQKTPTPVQDDQDNTQVKSNNLLYIVIAILVLLLLLGIGIMITTIICLKYRKSQNGAQKGVLYGPDIGVGMTWDIKKTGLPVSPEPVGNFYGNENNANVPTKFPLYDDINLRVSSSYPYDEIHSFKRQSNPYEKMAPMYDEIDRYQKVSKPGKKQTDSEIYYESPVAQNYENMNIEKGNDSVYNEIPANSVM